MISQKDSTQIGMDSWLLKLLSRDMKTKTKNKTIIKKTRKIKNNRKVKAMRKITPTMDHYPRNGEMGDTDP